VDHISVICEDVQLSIEFIVILYSAVCSVVTNGLLHFTGILQLHSYERQFLMFLIICVKYFSRAASYNQCF